MKREKFFLGISRKYFDSRKDSTDYNDDPDTLKRAATDMGNGIYMVRELESGIVDDPRRLRVAIEMTATIYHLGLRELNIYRESVQLECVPLVKVSRI